MTARPVQDSLLKSFAPTLHGTLKIGHAALRTRQSTLECKAVTSQVTGHLAQIRGSRFEILDVPVRPRRAGTQTPLSGILSGLSGKTPPTATYRYEACRKYTSNKGSNIG